MLGSAYDNIRTERRDIQIAEVLGSLCTSKRCWAGRKRCGANESWNRAREDNGCRKCLRQSGSAWGGLTA